MSVFGWCNDGFHERPEPYHFGTQCPGVIATYTEDKTGHLRVTGERKCECGCHETQ